MPQTSRHRVASGPCRHRRWTALLLVWLLALAAGAAQGQPTVNGLFYGDGDDALYEPYATSVGGSVLYSYLDVATSTLYVALVVSHQVNDNVCAQKGSGNAYLQSGDAGDPIYWNSHRDCKRASDSEFAGFSLECAPMSPRSWTWQQALGCAQTPGPPPSNWVSAPTCPASVGVWPPSIVATTSWVANVNAFQANTMPAWNMYVVSNALRDWKTPFLTAFPDDVTQVPGYPTYSAAHEWEWSVVYEWSVDLGPGGTDCGNEAIFFITGESHHSPPKSGPESDIFPPPDDPPILSDYGDLPDSYGTLSASNGPRHYLKVTGPYLGSQVQTEGDGVPTGDASGDGAEEDGLSIVVTDDWDPGTIQSIDVVVGNAGPATVLAGWFDWNNDGDVADAGEFFTWPVVDGNNSLNVLVGTAFDWATDDLHVRLRLFSSPAVAPGGSLDSGDYVGIATDGEVEDYFFTAGSLPVTLNAFVTEHAGGGSLTVRWQTASETDNVGFEIYGLVQGRWQSLSDFVPSKGSNSAQPESYETEISLPAGLTRIELVDYDSRGRAERFGPFHPGAAYGEFQDRRPVDWSGPRQRRARRLEARGFVDTERGNAEAAPASKAERWRKVRGSGAGRGSQVGRRLAKAMSVEVAGGETIRLQRGSLTHVAVTEPGVQRVTYEALRDGGLDLAGARERQIAVTWRGQPVARYVEGQGPFGPGSWIDFVGRPPSGDEALYLDANLYQISLDPDRALAARRLGSGKARRPSVAYSTESMVDRPAYYHRQSPTGDPWVEPPVLVRDGGATVDLEIPVDGPVLPGPARLIVGLGTISDMPDVAGPGGEPIPEHNVEVWFAGPGSGLVHVADASTSGQRDWRIEADLPPDLLASGVNRLQLRFATDYLFSLVVIDRFGVRYPTAYLGPRLDFEPDPDADGYVIDGFTRSAVVAYAEHADGGLTRMAPRVTPSGGGVAAALRQLAASRYWVAESPHAPAVFTTEAPGDLLGEPAELLVIAESSFVGTPALDTYLAERSELRPVVVDVEDIYNSTGYGMALPAAITDYLRARDAVQPFSHVQLVGTDCYDRRNYLSECLSLIPLPTAPVGVNIYSPSQNRLVDLDGDGVGDKAVAQFSVRDESELDTIVRKGAAWRALPDLGAPSALLIAEETDGVHNFTGQIERLRRRLRWAETEVLDLTGHPDIATARQALRQSLDEGRTLTVFSGHSSPSVWGFRALLTAPEVAKLSNFDHPTLMVPLACETTYDISPDTNVLGHQLLYAGDQGALAITGAVALSSLEDNERMAAHVVDALDAGLTLGAAVQAGREALGTAYQTLQDNWMTQGDVAARIRR